MVANALISQNISETKKKKCDWWSLLFGIEYEKFRVELQMKKMKLGN